MNYLNKEKAEELFNEAIKASSCSYSPYSNFSVGAALLTHDDKVFLGTNIENVSYTGTIHAEKVAVSAAIMAGYRGNYKAIAVYADTDTISPCGDCRQFLIEFGKDTIVIFKNEGEMIQRYVHELLNFQFDKKCLK